MPSVPNLTTNVLLRSEETSGHVSVTEITVPPHTAGPPLHTHDFDEAFYMLEGELIFKVEDELATKRAGELSFAPPNAPPRPPNPRAPPAASRLALPPPGPRAPWMARATPAASSATGNRRLM